MGDRQGSPARNARRGRSSDFTWLGWLVPLARAARLPADSLLSWDLSWLCRGHAPAYLPSRLLEAEMVGYDAADAPERLRQDGVLQFRPGGPGSPSVFRL